ncbi:putative pectinesterase [Helianthus debilis subsp. tardiflorus]
MEESIRFIRSHDDIPSDYGETSASPRQPPAKTHHRTIPTIITLTIFAIIIGTIITVTIIRQHHQLDNFNNHLRRRHNKRPKFEQSASVIHTVCAVTQHPESCFADVSEVINGDIIDPMMIFNITLHLAVKEVVNTTLMSKTLIIKANDLYTGLMFRECVSLFDDAVSRLSRAVEIVNGDGKVADLVTWVSAAMTDLEKCVEGLEELGSMVADEVKVRVKRSSVYLSNSLAILANMEGLLERK